MTLALVFCAIFMGEPVAETCFKSGEKSDGLSKICYYRCTCGTKALNVSGYAVCPFTASFDCW